MQKSIETRDYREGDEEAVIGLYNSVFGQSRDLLEWRWMFEQHPLKRKWIRLAISDDGKIVGQFAIMPVKYLVDGKVSFSGIAVDAFAGPDYRGRGLFQILGRELIDSAECTEIGIITAFPNENSHGPFVNKLKWSQIGHMHVLVRPLSFWLTLAQYKKSKPPGVLKWIGVLADAIYRWVFRIKKADHQDFKNIEKVNLFDSKFDELFRKHSLRFADKCIVYKDADYMNWRYLKIPSGKYEIHALKSNGELSGVLVTSRTAARGAIVDLICADGKTEDTLIDFALMKFYSMGTGYALSWSVPGSLFFKKLRRRGFLTAKKFPFTVDIRKPGLETAKRDSNWHLLPGDNDSY